MSVCEIPDIDQLFRVGEGAQSLEEKAKAAEVLRTHFGRHFDLALLARCEGLSLGLEQAAASQEELREVLEQLSAPPWHVARFLSLQSTRRGEEALVTCGGADYVVAISPDVPTDSLVLGDEVLLSQEKNCLMVKVPGAGPTHGETGTFSRAIGNGRLVIENEGREVVVMAAAVLDAATLSKGDQVLFHARDGIAYEKVERAAGRSLFCEEITPESPGFEAIGGLDKQIREIREALEIHMDHPEVAAKWQLERVGGILLTGPPGVGKTMLIRGAATHLARTSPAGRARYVHVRPGEFKVMWYGESEHKIRDTFKDLREAAREEPNVPAILHLAEVDSIASVRGQSFSRIDDRVSQALMEELDGITGRGNIMVIADTNRPDILDPAMLRGGRLGDLPIEVPRPGMTAAREIFAKHLPTDIPYRRPRTDIIESCLSVIFSPNGESELATVTFRDGKRQSVRCADLVNGAVIANVCRKSIRRAAVREIHTDTVELKLEDFLTAIREEFDAVARVLTPVNIRHHLSSLPQDTDVVAVERVSRKVRQPHRYLSLSVA